MKTLILSAGQGRRLLPLTASRPKCLIQLHGRTLLEWQLRSLAAAGVREATVLVGYGADQVEREIAEKAPHNMSVQTIYNPFFEVADNLGSCWVAREVLQGDCLILNGDTLIEPAIVQRLLAADVQPITVTIDRKGDYDTDDMKVRTENGLLRSIGKTLPMQEVNGESIGFLRFTPEGAARFVAEVERIMRTPEGLRLWYLSVIDRIAKTTGEVCICSIEGLGWGEVDFLADVEISTRLVAGWSL